MRRRRAAKPVGLQMRPPSQTMSAMETIYLDHAATTPLLAEAAEAMATAQRAGYMNPASQHGAGRRARRVLEEARERIGILLGADMTSARPDRVIFTSGGTEANNLALLGKWEVGSRKSELPENDDRAWSGSSHFPLPTSHFVVSSVEHPSVLGPAERLQRLGVGVVRLPVDRNGRIDPADVAARLTSAVRLVSIMLGNNETGILQPVRETAAVCRAAGVLMHTDAVQAVGKMPVDFRALGVDLMTVAAHKFHGPVGIGALVVRSGVDVAPQLFGGFQQGGLRPGTEAVAPVLGMLAALESWHREAAERTARLTTLRDRFEADLAAALPDLVIHGRHVPRLPQTSNVAFIGVDRQTMLLALDQAGICCSTGSACASGSSEPSPTLVAMGCSADELSSSLRFSLGAGTTAAETAEAARRIVRVYHELRRQRERRKLPTSGR